MSPRARRTALAWLLAAPAGLAGASPAAAPAHPRSLAAPLLEVLPLVDGRLEEPLWTRAGVARDFIQAEPREGAAATLPTEVFVFYTRDALVIGARLEDSHPDRVVAREYRRDANLDSDDNFTVVLDTYHDHRNAFFFTTNAAGTRKDGLVQNEGADLNTEWDGVWQVGSRRTESGWSTEIVIPFETLRFPAGAAEFGVNFGRQVARTREQTFWAPISNDWGFNAMWRISAYGLLTGLEHAEPGGRLKLKPFGVSGIRSSGGEREGTLDGGLDAKVALGSNLNLDVTVNTDFAQVEADEQQVNLTRFELFFPEQRDFFLENAGLFQVGETSLPFEPPQMLLFFSRRIGLSDDGEIVPILGGARLTGKLGATDVGAFHIRQEELAGETGATGFSALRLRRDVLARSSIGVLALDRSETGVGSHRLAAADFSWAPAGAARVNGFAAKSATEGAEGRESAFGLHAEATNDRWLLSADYTDIGEGFESQLGFVPRTGIRKIKVNGLWNPRPGRFGIRQIFFGPDFLRISETDGTVQTQNVAIGPYLLFDNGSSAFFNVGRSVEGLSESFSLREGVVIEAGEYVTRQLVGMFESSESRRLSGNLFTMTSGFFGGTLRVFSPGIAFRPHPRVRFRWNYSRSEIRLPQPGGAFDTNLLILRGFAALSPDAYIRGLLQWNRDAEDDNFSGNIQLRWTYAPGSDLYLVYTERRSLFADAAEPDRRELLVKATWYWSPG